MMDPAVFGRQLERLMAGEADDPFWLSHLDELTPCQLGALYVALRLVKVKHRDALDKVVALLGLSEPWVVNGR